MHLKLWKQVNLSLVAPFLIASAIVLYAVFNLGTISKRINFIEIADDINIDLLELRRYEKNIILFKEESNVGLFYQYLERIESKIQGAEREIIEEINKVRYKPLRENMRIYREAAVDLISSVKSESKLIEDIRPLGRLIEKKALRRDMALDLRRYEKNYIIYREQQAAKRMKEIARNIVRIQPDMSFAVNRYLTGFEALASSEALRASAVEKMRVSGRAIEEITREFAAKKRQAIDQSISVARKMFIVSLLFLLVSTLAMAYMFSSSVVRTLKVVGASLSRLKKGDYTQGIDMQAKNVPDEIHSFINTYNETIMDLGQKKGELEFTLKKLEDTNRELVEKQDTLVEARKLTAMRLLASEIAHEINNPLSSVITFLSLFCEDMQADPGKKEALEIMLKEVNRCQTVLRELVDFARKEPLRLREIDPAKLFRDAIKVSGKQNETSGINLIAFVGELPGKVVIDPVLVHQVLVNILGNAYHFSKPGDSIEIEGYSICNDMIIEIKDSGVGIPEDNLPYIFEPFFSTRAETGGSGLGLAIAKKIVERHNGSLQVESTVDEGTVFKITLPTNQESS